MPTWPSGTKASTTNVDEGTDLISNARADIKQNFDNVNDIIDTFNISSPSDGDLLQYSNSSGQWEQVASTSVGSSLQIAVVSMTSGEELVSGNTYRRAFTIDADSNSIVTEDSAGDFTFELATGTYLFAPNNQTAVVQQSNITLFNESDSASAGTFDFNEIGTTGEGIIQGTQVITVTSGPKAFSFRQSNNNLVYRNATPTFTITKLS
jgi:hypothetical protein